MRCEVAPRTLAREDVRSHDDRLAVAHEFTFEQALVDRSELLHAQVAVVDVAAPAGALLERQCVDDVGQELVAEPNVGEQRRALPVEQAAVVGRQADGGVTPVDGRGEIVDRGPVAGGGGREGVVPILALPDVVAHLHAESVVVVAFVANGQQLAIFGVEDEQQTIEQREGRVAHVGQRCVRRGLRDGAREFREDVIEDQVREVGRDALLVVPAFFQRPPMESAPVRGGGQKRIPAEEEHEHRQPVAAVRGIECEQALVVSGRSRTVARSISQNSSETDRAPW